MSNEPTAPTPRDLEFADSARRYAQGWFYNTPEIDPSLTPLQRTMALESRETSTNRGELRRILNEAQRDNVPIQAAFLSREENITRVRINGHEFKLTNNAVALLEERHGALDQSVQASALARGVPPRQPQSNSWEVALNERNLARAESDTRMTASIQRYEAMDRDPAVIAERTRLAARFDQAPVQHAAAETTAHRPQLSRWENNDPQLLAAREQATNALASVGVTGGQQVEEPSGVTGGKERVRTVALGGSD